MPKKQTRESIEADLNASEVDRAIAKLQETMRDMQEFDRRLQSEEKECGITPVSGTPLIERMAAV
jgi:hypothetical protein